jgi:anaerobic magnesium-protoporphyrin IX monomethyl ester cyclase
VQDFMAGETPKTIRETIELSKYAQTLGEWQNPNDLSINYAQALPGTPLYEFGRLKGIIGAGENEEEECLLRISDKDAHDEFATLNFTDYPSLVCQTWRPLITIEVNYAYVRKYGIDHYRKIILDDAQYFTRERKDEGYFANPKRLMDRSMTTDTINELKAPTYKITPDETRFPSLLNLIRSGRLGLAMVCYPVLFYRLRHFLIFMVLYKNIAKAGFGYALKLIVECLRNWLRIDGASRVMTFTHKSLRKFKERDNGEQHYGEGAMVPLRKGR